MTASSDNNTGRTSRPVLRVSLDFETQSECDLIRAGTYNYAKHLSTRVLCAAWCLEDKQHEPKVWYPGDPPPFWVDEPCVIHAFNAQFERLIWQHVLNNRWGPVPPLSRFVCTAALGRAHGLRGGLDAMAQQLGLKTRKDREGRMLMLRLCKPNKLGVLPQPTEQELKRLGEYCAQDVRTEQALHDALPMHQLPVSEQRLYEATERMNDRGVLVDPVAINAVLVGLDRYRTALTSELGTLTGGLSPNQVAKLGTWFGEAGHEMDDLRAETLRAELPNFEGNVRRVAEIRLELARASTSKFDALRLRADPSSNRVRGHIMHNGAHTGRDSHPGAQLGNLMRSSLPGIEALADNLPLLADPFLLGAIEGDPMRTYGALVRPMLVAPQGKVLGVGDYGQIEARVLAWLAGEQGMLDAFTAKRDLYREMASAMYGVPPEQVTSQQRQVGKAAVLGCGFQMGAPKFHLTANAQGAKVSMRDAQLAVDTYRGLFQRIVNFWYELGNAFKFAHGFGSGEPTRVGKLELQRFGHWTTIRLPSGRRLWYFNVRYVPNPDDDTLQDLVFGGHGVTSKLYGGKLAENVTQAVARDLLMGAFLRCEAADLTVVHRVHDELVTEGAPGHTPELGRLMLMRPTWAEGLPLTVDTFECRRYRKG